MPWLAAQIHSGIHSDQPQRSNHQLQRCNSPTFPLYTGCVDHFVLQLLVQSHAMRRSHQISRSIPLFTVCCDIYEPRKVLLITFVLYSATSQAITPCNMSNASNITFVSVEHWLAPPHDNNTHCNSQGSISSNIHTETRYTMHKHNVHKYNRHYVIVTMHQKSHSCFFLLRIHNHNCTTYKVHHAYNNYTFYMCVIWTTIHANVSHSDIYACH